MFKGGLKISLFVSMALALSACTQQLNGSFRYLQQDQSFSTSQFINTKIDILWVVDNSSSMDVSQQKLRAGFQSFAATYLKPNLDIRLAAITTDTYLANPAFSGYLASNIGGTVGYSSAYIDSRLSSFVNPTWSPSLVNLSTGKFDSGVTYGNMLGQYGSNYAKLLPGIHDGPMTGLCVEFNDYFYGDVSDCRVRDQAGANTGTSACLNPNTGAGESSLSQCVNTSQNDTVRSGSAILNTKPPTGVAGDAAWVQQLTDNFTVNMSVGSWGGGSERGLGSVLQLLSDNETTASAFFRPNSLRVIIFLSDEDDQTAILPSPAPVGYTPFTNYTSSCASKTVDGYTYTLSTCPIPSTLQDISDIKSQFDTFFQNLDGSGIGGNPNYFVASIVSLSGANIEAMQQARNATDTALGIALTVSEDRGDRYIDFGNLVGNGSAAYDIGDADYTSILGSIGQSIVASKSTFTLDRAPTSQEDMIVSILHADGSVTVLTNAQYSISGKVVTITDDNLLLSLTDTDQISINYQPATAY